MSRLTRDLMRWVSGFFFINLPTLQVTINGRTVVTSRIGIINTGYLYYLDYCCLYDYLYSLYYFL